MQPVPKLTARFVPPVPRRETQGGCHFRISQVTDALKRSSVHTSSVHLTTTTPNRDELLSLYSSVGWSAYTADPDALQRAVQQSHLVLSARSETGELLGLARTVSDDVSIVYVQDLLIRPEAQRQGLGRALMEQVMARYAHVMQQVLITGDEAGPLAFYASLGWHNTRDLKRMVTHCYYRDNRHPLS